MNWLAKFRSRKYLRRLLLTITILVVGSSLLTSFFLFYHSEQTVLESQFEATEKVLGQTKYNIDYIDQMITNMGLTLYNDPNVASLFYSRDLEAEEYYTSLQRLDRTVNSTTFLDSIMIYNSYADSFVSTRYYPTDPRTAVHRDAIYAVIADYFKAGGINRETKWIPFRSGQNDKIEFFSFFLFDALPGQSATANQSTLILNVKTDWFFKNIQVINDLAVKGNTTLVLDRKGQLLYPANGKGEAVQELIMHALAERDAGSNRTDGSGDADQHGSFIAGKGADKAIVSHIRLENGWGIVTYQPYGAVLENIHQLRLTYIVFTAGFLLVFLLVSVYVAQLLYRPIENIVRRLGEHVPDDEPRGKDEIHYMMRVYDRVTEEMKLMKRKHDASRSVANQYYLRMILNKSSTFSVPEFAQIIEQYGLQIRPSGAKIVAALSIDDYDARENRKRNAMDDNVLLFAIGNIASEIIEKAFMNEILEKSDGTFTLLISAESDGADAIAGIAALIREVQTVIHKFYKLSLTAAISESSPNHQDISLLVRAAEDALLYRIVYGRMALITPQMVARMSVDDDKQKQAELDKKIVEAIHLEDASRFQAVLERWYDYAAEQEYDTIIHAVLHIAFLMKQTMKAVRAQMSVKLAHELNGLNRQILSEVTLSDIRDKLRHLFNTFLEEKTKETAEDRNEILVQTIKEIIRSNYRDVNLSLQSIADTLGMSDKYIGRQFKGYETISVAEYMMDVRLGHALKLLEETSLTVKEIIEQIGLVNESHFFRVFKKKFGATPREYLSRRQRE